MRTRIPFVLVVVASLISGRTGAQEPQQPSRHPHEYDIQPNSGNYAICVTSYMGDTAFQMASDMVSELRANYKLPAFFYSRTELERQKEYEHRKALWEQRQQMYKDMGLERPEKFKFQRVKIQDQYAVLLCAPPFKDIDTTRKHLDAIRKQNIKVSDRLLHLMSLRLETGTQAAAARENPFETAFVVPNPAAPKSKTAPAPDKKDEVSLRDWNSGESLSAVHKIPGKWTLVVKVYRAPLRIVSQNQDRSSVERTAFGGGQQGDLTDANMKMAHQMAELLRNPQLGFDAYVVHMPRMSIVTVGSFDGKDDVRMMAVANSINKLHLNLQGGAMSSEMLESPTPWQVPTR